MRPTRFAVSLCALSTALVAAGCGGRIASEEGLADASVAPAEEVEVVGKGQSFSSPEAACSTTDGRSPTKLCRAHLRAGEIAADRSICYVDLAARTGDLGVATYACEGDPTNWAIATFGSRAFVGGARDGVVDVCTGTTFRFQDGCTWATSQRIFGDLASGQLSFTYEEAPIRGEKCFSPCKAHGRILVE